MLSTFSAFFTLTVSKLFFLTGHPKALGSRVITAGAQEWMLCLYSLDGNSGEDFNKDSIERDERRLTELGHRTLEIFVLAHIFRILQWGEDRRFDEMRNNLDRLAIFWIFQAVWVWAVSLPVIVANASDRNPFLQVVDILGWIMWSVGFIVEGSADQQKLSFKKSSENRGRWCNVGLWKYSRHPNYFGEILLWWGIFLASTPVLKNAEWLVIIGPIFLTLLLLFISGIPMLEDSADKKFGNVEGYRAYKRRTSHLIPLPPPVHGNLPTWFKTTFLFEFPLYNRNLPQEELNWCVWCCGQGYSS